MLSRSLLDFSNDNSGLFSLSALSTNFSEEYPMLCWNALGDLINSRLGVFFIDEGHEREPLHDDYDLGSLITNFARSFATSVASPASSTLRRTSAKSLYASGASSIG